MAINKEQTLGGVLIILSLISLTSCTAPIPNCQTPTQDGRCLLCEEGYRLSEDSEVCLRSFKQFRDEQVIQGRLLQACNNVANCMTCNSSNPNQCITCNTGFDLDNMGGCNCPVNSTEHNGMCVDCIANCRTCQVTNICSDCNTNYVLRNNGGLCFSCNVAGCSNCSSANFCVSCSATGAAPNLAGDTCFSCGSGCQVCADGTTCAVCSQGLEHNNDNTQCITCNVNGCMVCSTTDTCHTCEQGFERAANGASCFICLEPFATCDSNGNGATCVSPYSLNVGSNGACFLCDVSDCSICSETNRSRCTTCNTGFTSAADGSCSAQCSDANCRTCATPTTCATCFDFYTVVNGGCTKCTDSNCLVCPAGDASGRCETCIPGYYYSNSFGGCRTCASFCLECTSRSNCQVLKDNVGKVAFTDTNNMLRAANCDSGCKRCSSSNPELCLDCKDGFYGPTNENVCKACTFPCATCMSSDPSACLTCVDGTHLQNNQCVECAASCNTCTANDPNSCTSCPIGIVLSNNACSGNCIENCRICTTTTTCNECNEGFAVDASQTCRPCLSNCKRCSGFNSTNCLDCGSGLVAFQGDCLSCPNNCQECSRFAANDIRCKTCYPGYQVTDNFQCSVLCNDPCATCASNNPDFCMTCIAGYNQDAVNGVCSGVPNCMACTACPLGYRLNTVSETCVQCEGNCAKCDIAAPASCESCFDGFYLTTGGACTACPEGCKTCTGSRVCQTCLNGWTLNDNPAAAVDICQKCEFPCSACQGNPKHCTQCVEDYGFVKRKCVSQSTVINFGCTLDTQPDTFYSQWRTFFQYLRDNSASANIENVTLNQGRTGSIITSGTVSISTASRSANLAATDSLTSALTAGRTIGSMPIMSSSVDIVPARDDNETAFSRNLALILGLSIPLAVIFLILVFICFMVYRNRPTDPEMEVRMSEDDIFSQKTFGKDGYQSNMKDQKNVKHVEPI